VRPSLAHALPLCPFHHPPVFFIRGCCPARNDGHRTESMPLLVRRCPLMSSSAGFLRYTNSSARGYQDTIRLVGHFPLQRIERFGGRTLLASAQQTPLRILAVSYRLWLKLLCMSHLDAKVLPE
jgi:hypothetical protein